MKCKYCENELPNTRGYAKIEKDGRLTKGKIACCKEGCISFNLKSGSKRFQEIVMGIEKSLLEEMWRARIEKSTKTNIARGNFSGDRNPVSKTRLKNKGLSEQEISEILSKKAIKSSRTKKDKGFYDDKSNNPYSKEFWGKRGLTEKQAKEKIRERIHNTAEFWIKRGLSAEDAKRAARKSAATNSLENKIEKWGDEAEKKYVEVREKLSKSWKPSNTKGQKFSSSKQANKFFKKIYKFCRRLGYIRNDIVFKLNRGEWFLRDSNSIFFYDFMLKPLKLIIEFNGEHVHPNKNKLSEEEWKKWRHAYTKKCADEIHENDLRKLTVAKILGYNVLEVWSQDPSSIENAFSFIRKHHECKGNTTQCKNDS
jgi:hypothetical protein